MRRNLHPLTVAEEATFVDVLLAYEGIRVSQAVRLTKTDLAKRGLFSPSLEMTFERFAHNWKNWNKVREATL